MHGNSRPVADMEKNTAVIMIRHADHRCRKIQNLRFGFTLVQPMDNQFSPRHLYRLGDRFLHIFKRRIDKHVDQRFANNFRPNFAVFGRSRSV